MKIGAMMHRVTNWPRGGPASSAENDLCGCFKQQCKYFWRYLHMDAFSQGLMGSESWCGWLYWLQKCIIITTAVSSKSLKTVSECYIWQAVFTFNTYTGCVLQKSVIQFFGAQKEHFRYQKGRCLSEKWCPFKCTAHSLSDILNCIFQIQNEYGLNLQWNYYLEKLPFWISKIYFWLVTIPTEDIFNSPQFENTAFSSLYVLNEGLTSQNEVVDILSCNSNYSKWC